MLLLFVIVSLFFSGAIGAPQIWPFLNNPYYLDGRIIGGVDASIEEFPYQVSLQEFGEHICGGVIISNDYVLTAAHCYRFFTEWYSIRAGSSIHNSDGVVIQVQTIYVHPDYNFLTAEYDIAIIHLSSSLLFSASIAPVNLPLQDQIIPAGVEGVVTGWGYLEENGSVSILLQAVRVPIVSQEDCDVFYESHFRSITDSMICAGFVEGGRDACQGDSGGPLVVNGELVGLVSWGQGCARPNFPGVYASIPHARSYIYEITGI